MEEVHVREQFPKYIDSVPGTGVLLQLEDGLRQTIRASLFDHIVAAQVTQGF